MAFYKFLVTLEVVADSQHHAYESIKRLFDDRRADPENFSLRYVYAECEEVAKFEEEESYAPNLGVYGRG